MNSSKEDLMNGQITGILESVATECCVGTAMLKGKVVGSVEQWIVEDRCLIAA